MIRICTISGIFESVTQFRTFRTFSSSKFYSVKIQEIVKFFIISILCPNKKTDRHWWYYLVSCLFWPLHIRLVISRLEASLKSVPQAVPSFKMLSVKSSIGQWGRFFCFGHSHCDEYILDPNLGLLISESVSINYLNTYLKYHLISHHNLIKCCVLIYFGVIPLCAANVELCESCIGCFKEAQRKSPSWV